MKSLIYFLLLVPFSTMAGVMNGGGGKSVVCRDAAGAIQSAEVLDLYEGRVQYGLTYSNSSKMYDQQVHDVLTASGLGADESFPPNNIYDYYLTTRSHLQFVPIGAVLQPINDSLEVIAPKNCAIEQTVNYLNDRLVLVSTEIWNALSETQRAALLIHEASYRFLRNYRETDSRRARHLTAHLFSGGKIVETYPGNDYEALCETNDKTKPLSRFYVSKVFVDKGYKKVRLSFSDFDGRKLLSRSTAEIYSDGAAGKSFLELLKNPDPSNQLIVQGLTTTSLFEGGDVSTLRIGGSLGEKRINFSGISGVDGKEFDEQEIKCIFLDNP